MSADPNTTTPAPVHDPPSLPSSPLPKRTRAIEPSGLSQASNLARGSDTAAATPTPPPLPLLTGMSAPQPVAPPLAPSHASSAAAASSSSSLDLPDHQLHVLLLSDQARAPTKGSAFAAGHDLYSARDVTIPSRGRALVPTDISISLPAGTYGRVAPRSGLAHKHGIDTLAGVIDADYRGPLGIILANLSDTDFAVKVGDRIAQLIVEKIVMPRVVVVQKLEESVRGTGGFGSTGGFGAALEQGSG